MDDRSILETMRARFIDAAGTGALGALALALLVAAAARLSAPAVAPPLTIAGPPQSAPVRFSGAARPHRRRLVAPSLPGRGGSPRPRPAVAQPRPAVAPPRAAVVVRSPQRAAPRPVSGTVAVATAPATRAVMRVAARAAAVLGRHGNRATPASILRPPRGFNALPALVAVPATAEPATNVALAGIRLRGRVVAPAATAAPAASTPPGTAEVP